MPVLKNLSLAQKLIALSMATSLIALLIAGSVWVIDSWFSGRESAREEINTLAHLIADRSNAALAFNDAGLAEQNLNALRNLPTVLIACMYDETGAVFASYSQEYSARCPQTDSVSSTLTASRMIDTYVPVMLDERTIGNLYMRSDLTRVQTRVQRALITTVLVLFVAGLISYIVSKHLQRLISEPITKLSKTAQIIAEEHNYSVRASRQSDDELGRLVDTFNVMLETIERQNMSLTASHDELERLVEKRTAELQSSNRELEAFCYSVSHDLRSPLRSINGFSQALLDDYETQIDETGKDYLQRVMNSAVRMDLLIEGLLRLSRVTRSELKPELVDMSRLAREVSDEQLAGTERDVSVEIQPDVQDYGDQILLRVILDNLIGNAIKYSSRKEHARVSFGKELQNGTTVYRVKDNGAGFDMQHADKLFGVFQRLHSSKHYEGTGIGLATVARLVTRHGGKVWAEAEVDKGASFYFTLAASGVGGESGNV